MTADWINIYQHVPPPVHTITVGVYTLKVDDSTLEDKEITWAVRRLCLNRFVGPLGMPAEHLCQWLIYATREDTPDVINWHKVVAIIQAEFRDGTMEKESRHKTVVLITKWESGDFGGIGLVERLCNTITSLLNRRLTIAIQFS